MSSRGINKVIVVGFMGNDPETRYTQNDMAITRISVATTSVRKDRDGNQQERTEWHRVVFFGKLAEIAGEYLRKGSQVYIEGSLRYDKYTGQDGVEKYTTDIVADELQMLGGRGDNSGGGRQDRDDPPRRNDDRQDNRDNRGSRNQAGGNSSQSRSGQGGNRNPPPRRDDRQESRPRNDDRRQPAPAGNFHDDFADDNIPF